MICRMLPWHRRTARAERRLHEARLRLHEVNQDWTPLAKNLSRIDNEIRLNDWTRTARDIFSGGRR